MIELLLHPIRAVFNHRGGTESVAVPRGHTVHTMYMVFYLRKMHLSYRREIRVPHTAII